MEQRLHALIDMPNACMHVGVNFVSHVCSREHTLRRVASRCGILLQQHQRSDLSMGDDKMGRWRKPYDKY